VAANDVEAIITIIARIAKVVRFTVILLDWGCCLVRSPLYFGYLDCSLRLVRGNDNVTVGYPSVMP
jgi:hypothetical protein